jgi:predicted RNase H-like HicB family nuclease
MSSASASRSKSKAAERTATNDPHRPIPDDLIQRGRKLAAKYRMVIERAEHGGFFGSTIEMPLAFGEGKTIEACARDILEATALSIAVTLENGERPPAPSREAARTQQVNIRISGEEKLQLEAIAKRDGYRSLSDLVRAAALRSIKP